jgi:hypothetical protein
MEVPDLMAKAEGFFPAGTSALSVDGIAAARMLTPGAIRSGCHTQTQKTPSEQMLINPSGKNPSLVLITQANGFQS